MSQSRKGSALEAATNMAVGFGVNYLANFAILPLFGFHIMAVQNLGMGVIYTGISLARSYVLRRAFNAANARATK